MCNCNNIVKATSVAVVSDLTEDYIEITVPATVTFDEDCLRIGLFTTIPTTVNCARVVVTNGTDSYNILRCNGNYWRPCQLKCRSVLNCRVFSDPDHLLITRG